LDKLEYVFVNNRYKKAFDSRPNPYISCNEVQNKEIILESDCKMTDFWEQNMKKILGSISEE
jgi:hypothetical protein